MNNHQTPELSFEQIRRICDPAQFDFKNTGELPDLKEVIGQDRALSAVTFGIEIESPGYHMYALGPVGTGKTTTIHKFLDGKAESQPVPDDWCYINNFDDSDKPRALRLPAGKGCELQEDIDELIEDLKTEVPQAFEGEEYQQQQEQLQEELQESRQELLNRLESRAQSKNFTLLQTPQGIMFAPIVDGEVMTPDRYNELDEEQRKQLEENRQELQNEMRESMRHVRQLQKDARQRVREMDRQVVGFAIEHFLQELHEKYAEFDEIIEFLDNIRTDILDNVQALKQAEQAEQMQQQIPMMPGANIQKPTFDHYRVNVIVDNRDLDGAPVILEHNPSYHNLIGRIEHEAQFGALVTNFTMIKPGALHRANGGYLMVNARDLLLKPFAWEALKRTLKNKEIKIEPMGEELRAVATRTLEPEAIPLDVKVIIIGDPYIYYLLYSLDEDFQELFKVKADFDNQMDWNGDTVEQYAQFIGAVCRDENLHHFDPTGVAKVIERSARMVADQTKLATKFGDVVDLVRQASYWASQNGHDAVTGEDVQRAIDEQIYRSNRIEERLREMIEDGTILIDTEGETVGQVNGISVVPLGDYAFGKPSRITARAYVGSAGVVNIDRETELGGRIHNKGMMILAGYLGGKYAQDEPLALSASLVFEQIYEEIDGDSASSAELYALLSSLADAPIRQDLAVTGSVNQRGQIQAIGGVNEKVEGFFDVCRMKGLTGSQGMVIPSSNVKNLMLREDVVETVQDGQFHIYPVETVDEGIALLTGRDAGERQADGTYPDGTINWAVQKRLKELAENVKAFTRQGNDSSG